MSQYYQLTPDILLEYVCESDPKLNEDGIRGNEKDICDENSSTILLKSNAFASKYLCFKNESEGLNSISNLVLPLNNTETQFAVAKNIKNESQYFYSTLNASNIYTSKNGSGYIYENTNYDVNIKNNAKNNANNSNGSCDVKYDRCIIHFTSKNYFGKYDSLIFQAYVYMKNKAKLYFASFLFKKTSDLKLKAEHLLYNEKLYTTQIEFDIPSVSAIFIEKNKKSEDYVEDEQLFVKALKSQNIELLENTPIGISMYGVSGSTNGADEYTRLKTFKINSISIPYVYNKLDEIYIDIHESTNGDYYEIEPKMGSGYSSFVDYIESMGESIQAYMIMHELYLREVWVDADGVSHSENTHNECHIITINEDDEDEEISAAFNKPIYYRPICMKSGFGYTATIIDTIKVINTVDSSSYEVTGSLKIENPHKYGMKLKQLDIARPIVNVYNKKVSDEKGSGINRINLSRGSGFVIENNSQNITSFIECTNIGVSILEISPEDIS